MHAYHNGITFVIDFDTMKLAEIIYFPCRHPKDFTKIERDIKLFNSINGRKKIISSERVETGIQVWREQ